MVSTHQLPPPPEEADLLLDRESVAGILASDRPMTPDNMRWLGNMVLLIGHEYKATREFMIGLINAVSTMSTMIGQVETAAYVSHAMFKVDPNHEPGVLLATLNEKTAAVKQARLKVAELAKLLCECPEKTDTIC